MILSTVIIGLILCIVILKLGGIWVWPGSDNNHNITDVEYESYEEYVCRHMMIPDNGTPQWFPEFFEQRMVMNSIFNGADIYFDGAETTPKSWDDRGVTCQMPIEVCIKGVYCVDMNMLINVNYTRWKEWANLSISYGNST